MLPKRIGARLSILVALLAGCSVPALAKPADLVLQNGKIYLVEPAGQWAEAIAIADGKIVAVGTRAEIKSFIGRQTRIIDLKGRMAMPGINDNHIHLAAAAADMMNYTCNIPVASSFEQLLDVVRACSAEKGPDEWIVGQAWSSALYGRLEQADALRALDAASGGRPVILRNDTIHDRWVNSRALAIAGITKSTIDPPAGKIGKDPKTGELNGLLIEGAGLLVTKHIPRFNKPDSLDNAKETLAFGLRYLNSVGVTGFDDALVSAGSEKGPGLGSSVEAYHALDQAGGLTARVATSIFINPEHPNLDMLFANRERFRSDKLSLDYAKIAIDGVMVSRTAIFLEPYLPDAAHGADFHGMVKIPAEQLNEMVTDLDKRGISAKLHVAGDGAVHMALDAIEAARKANGPNGPMHSLAHAGYITIDDIDRSARLNAAIDASPTVWYPGPILGATEAVIGKERANRFWPFRTMIDRGAIIAGGTDWKTLPEEFSDLWSGIEGMVSRRNPMGKAPGALWPEQAISLAETLKIYTLNSAQAMNLAGKTGSLVVGKSADLIVLGHNLFDIPVEQISETKVDMTLFEGKVVFQR